MKNLIFINGTMGIGKTTVCVELQKLLTPSVFLDGDWCWNMHPFIVTDETKKMVTDNICYLLNNFLRCSEYRNIIFCWVMDRQATVDSILSNLDLSGIKYRLFTLTASENALQAHFDKDIAAGKRTYADLVKSRNRLELYQEIDSIKIDVSEINAAEAAKLIATHLSGDKNG